MSYQGRYLVIGVRDWANQPGANDADKLNNLAEAGYGLHTVVPAPIELLWIFERETPEEETPKRSEDNPSAELMRAQRWGGDDVTPEQRALCTCDTVEWREGNCRTLCRRIKRG